MKIKTRNGRATMSARLEESGGLESADAAKLEGRPLVALLSIAVSDSPEAWPLGAASVGAAIREAFGAKLDLRLIEAGLDEDASELAVRLLKTEADYIGFSIYSWNRALAIETARLLRSSSPGLVLFAGGPEAGADAGRILETSALDFIVVGEGELSACAALRLLAAAPGKNPSELLAGLPDIALRGRPTRTGPRRENPTKPLELPSPWLTGLLDPRARGGALIWELARGCPFRCGYCYESKGEGRIRPFSMRRVEEELKLFVASGARSVFVLDPTFDADRSRALGLVELFSRRAPGLRWKFELRAELIDRGLARALARLDCSLQIGLQSAQGSTLALAGRPGFSRKDFARRISMLDEFGLVYGLDLIYGLPGDGLADFKDSLDWALGLGPNHLDIFPLAVLPGTDFAARADELGIKAEADPPYLVRSTRKMNAVDIEKAARLAEACDSFYSEGRAVGWFRAALAPLREKPSAFLARFADREAQSVQRQETRKDKLGSTRGAARAAASSASVEAAQLAFLERSYMERGLAKLWPALRDLVRLHGALGAALAEGRASELNLEYDADELMRAPLVGLAAFAKAAARKNQRLRIGPDSRGVPSIRRIDRSATARRRS